MQAKFIYLKHSPKIDANWQYNCYFYCMEKKHIVIAGEENQNTLPLTLMLESKRMKVSIYEYHESIINSFLVSQNDLHNVDLIIIGTKQSDEEILRFFSELKILNISIPYIILSNDNKNNLLSKLINNKFIGYTASISDPELILELIEVIFSNESRFK